MEMALTARKVSAREAAQAGLVTQVCQTQDVLKAAAFILAAAIAKKSPVAATGIKQVLLHARWSITTFIDLPYLLVALEKATSLHQASAQCGSRPLPKCVSFTTCEARKRHVQFLQVSCRGRRS